MTEESVSREEILDALQEAARDSLEVYRSSLECETFNGVIVDPDSEEMLARHLSDLKRWYSVLRRAGRDAGNIPELRSVGL